VLTSPRYTVLVRRYQNQGITLPSRASSPSESTAPFPNYPHDEDYYDSSNMYNNTLMPPHNPGTSAGSHRSWSSLDSEAAVSAWSNTNEYDPMASSSMSNVPDYGYSPRPHASHPSYDWTWHSQQQQQQSPVSYHAPTAAPAPQGHYDAYALAQPRAYSRSPARASYPGMLPNAVPTSTPRARTWSDQQTHDSLHPTTYPDPRLQQNPLYRF
jgi:hypothetical protein